MQASWMLPCRDLQHGLDHGMIGGRSSRQPAMQFDVLGARERRLHRPVDAIDRGIVEHDRGALRNGAAARPRCCGPCSSSRHQRRRVTAIGDRRRRREFGDQQFRIVDLRHHQDFAELVR